MALETKDLPSMRVWVLLGWLVIGLTASDAPAEPIRRGALLSGAKPISFAALLSDLESYRDTSIVVEGLVRRACSRKGCWMELAEGATDGTPGCRVTFKDYGFFVPTNSAGSRAKVEGKVQVERVPAKDVTHLESEGARFARKHPDGTADEVRIVATGVELQPPPQGSDP